MMDKDIKLVIRDLLTNQWDATETVLDSQPDIHTGWYDYDAGTPQVTITNVNHFTIGGGNTGLNAMPSGSGQTPDKRTGTILVNAWSGTRENVSQNPKKIAYSLTKHIDDIIGKNTTGHTHINSLATESVREIVEEDAPEVVTRREITARFTYVKT